MLLPWIEEIFLHTRVVRKLAYSSPVGHGGKILDKSVKDEKMKEVIKHNSILPQVCVKCNIYRIFQEFSEECDTSLTHSYGK